MHVLFFLVRSYRPFSYLMAGDRDPNLESQTSGWTQWYDYWQHPAQEQGAGTNQEGRGGPEPGLGHRLLSASQDATRGKAELARQDSLEKYS